MDIGARLRQIRGGLGYSQNMLANMAGISQTHLRRVELGQADITVGHLQLVCDVLGVTLKQFFDCEEKGDELSALLSALSPKQKALLSEFLKSIV